MSTPAQFAAKMRELPTQVERATESAVSKAALRMTLAARASIAAASGGDSRLSGVGKSGAKVGARYKIKRSQHNPSALVSAEGPLQLIERDTKAHGELPKGVGKAQGRTKAARYAAKQNLYDALFGSGGFAGTTPLSTPYGPRYRVQHPGTRGKHPFERAIDHTSPSTPEVFQREIHEAMARIFR